MLIRAGLCKEVNAMQTSLANVVCLVVSALAMLPLPAVAAGENGPMVKISDAKFNDLLALWQKNIIGDARNRYCDKVIGEDIAWLITPFTDGFYYGYTATGDPKWAEMLIDWTDSWAKRAVKEPDGFVGWPSPAAAGTKVDNLDDFNADSMLGDVMASRAAVLLATEIRKTPALKERYGAKADSYLALAEQLFEKWEQRGGWRQTKEGGCISVVLPFGIDGTSGKWTSGYATRNAPGNGFSHPDNKANLVARWLLALSDATGKPVYRERAQGWFKLMKSRMKLKAGGTYQIWNYWQPAGPWDYKPDGSTKHWVGVHPNPGYYQIDVAAIVDAYEHGLVFTRADIDRLVATALAEKRYWDALVPYSAAIQDKFEQATKPESWGGLSAVPCYLMHQARLRKSNPAADGTSNPGQSAPMVVDLWPGKAPEETGDGGAENSLMSPRLDHKQVEVTEPTRMVTNVTRPSITIRRPAKDKATGTAVLICPGGGYWNLYWQLEGEEVADWLNSLGVTGIILKYRVPRHSDEPKGEPARRPLQDAQRAVSLVRSNAAEWGIDAKRIGMVGFSAGGHLALATATNFQKRTYEPLDAVDKLSCRPDFAILCYSGYLKAKDQDELSPGLRIPAGTPPVFLVHGGDDIISDASHSVVTYLALKRAGVPAELHVYATAAHDFGVRASEHPCSTWTQACAAWLRAQGFLPPSK
jgi:acetyl esterase/lipase